jgi:hypothetical protein
VIPYPKQPLPEPRLPTPAPLLTDARRSWVFSEVHPVMTHTGDALRFYAEYAAFVTNH